MSEQNPKKAFEISWSALFKIAVAVLIFYFVYFIRDILLSFVFALIISILFDPIIDFLQKYKIPRILGVILVYVSVFGILAVAIYFLAPILINETDQFVQLFPYYFEKVSPSLKLLGVKAFENIDTFSKTLGSALSEMSASVLNSLFSIFGGITSTILIISIAIFLSLEEKSVLAALKFIFPKKYEDYITSLWQRSEQKVSGWFLSRIIASIFVGVASILLFYYFNVKYPVSLGLLAGLSNFIPIIGPLATGLLVFFLVAIDNIYRAVFILIGVALIQQIENTIITPYLSKRFFDLSAVIVLISLVVGAKIAGFLGVILCLPLAAIIFEFSKDFLEMRKKENSDED
ncbi:MAG: AI-2E family transporter [bacterium]|nr:AI-2E family transporter [bacterium]